MKVQICKGNVCKDRFSSYIKDRIENDIKMFDLKNVEIEEVACLGNCKKGPNIKIDNELFNNVNPAKASELLFKKLKNVKNKKYKK